MKRVLKAQLVDIVKMEGAFVGGLRGCVLQPGQDNVVDVKLVDNTIKVTYKSKQVVTVPMSNIVSYTLEEDQPTNVVNLSEQVISDNKQEKQSRRKIDKKEPI